MYFLITYHSSLITVLARPAALVARGDGVGARGGSFSRRLVGGRDADGGERARRDGLVSLGGRHVAAVAHRLSHHLLLEHHDGVDEHFGAGGTAGDVHVHGHDLVHALDDGVVVEDSARRGARA